MKLTWDEMIEEYGEIEVEFDCYDTKTKSFYFHRSNGDTMWVLTKNPGNFGVGEPSIIKNIDPFLVRVNGNTVYEEF